jgi:hypothetical protein
MINDFHLYPDADDAGVVDPEIALLTAYLARELSDVQVLAIEERLVTDAAFRATMQPLLDAWAAPVAVTGAPRLAPATLTDAELEADWRRFVEERRPAARQMESVSVVSAGEIGRSQTASPPVPRRAARMMKAAAVVAIIALPVIGIAQIVARLAKDGQDKGGGRPSPVAVPLTPPLSHGTDPALETRRSITLTPEMLAAGKGAEQQPMFRALSVSEDLRLPPKANPVGGVSVSDRGMIAVLTNARSQIIQVFTPAGISTATIGSSTPDNLWLAPGTGQQMGMGWVGDSVWIIPGSGDGPYQSLIAPNLWSSAGNGAVSRVRDIAIVRIEPLARLVRLTPVPAEISTPPGARSQPSAVGPLTTIYAVYPDGGVLGGQLQTPPEQLQRGFYANAGDFMRASPFVQFEGDGKRGHSWPNPVRHSSNGRCFESSFPLAPGLPVPFCMSARNLPSPNGRWMTYASGTTHDSTSVQLDVATVNLAGDTIYSRRFRIPGAPYDDATADSTRRTIINMYRISGYGPDPKDQVVIDSVLRVRRPQNVQPVAEVLTGNDGTVFVRLALRTPQQQWLVISAQGDAVGMASFPPGVSLRQVSRSAAWGVDRATNSVVRFRVGQ